MAKKIYHLASCNTCQKIIAALPDKNEFVLQNIKTEAITSEQLDEMKNLAGSYEALFSRKSKKYPPLKAQILTELDYKRLILEEYTFLKRPVIIDGEKISIGSGVKKT